MIVILRPDHTIVYFSPFAETAHRLLGRRGPSGATISRCSCPIRCGRTSPPSWSASSRASPTRGFENPVACRDGSRRWMVWNARYLADYEDGPAILKVGQDITFLKQAQERAVQSERLAAIGEMVTGLAHESRNALQRSQACLEMLALAVRDRPEALDLIGRIQKAQDHLHTLYEDVRGYAAPIKLDRTPCDLARIWREAWSHLESARAEKQAVLVEATGGLDLRCVADPFRLEQVFRNILDNALAAGSPPVAVEVRAEEVRLQGQPAIQVAFRDNGPGIPPDRRDRVFDPFYTTKAKGTGLGMAIATADRRGPRRPDRASAMTTGPGPPSSSLYREEHHDPCPEDRRRRRRAGHARLLPADPAAPGPPGRRGRPDRPRAGRPLHRHPSRPGHHRHQDARHGRHRRRRADLPAQRRSPSSWSRPITTPNSSAGPRPTTSWPTWSSRSSRPTSSRPSGSPCAASSSSRPSARRPPT